MKTPAWIIVFALLAGTGLFFTRKQPATHPAAPLSSSYTPQAVLELFTSEGCSSCPKADRLLPQLAAADSTVLALSFHVDYWDRMGWKDPFSNADYSARQRAYGEQMKLRTVYTPQLVVNGKYELVGSNRVQAEQAIRKVKNEGESVQLAFHSSSENKSQVKGEVSMSGDLDFTDLLILVVQRKATIQVRGGENGGSTLDHFNIVRSMVRKKASSKLNIEAVIPADAGDCFIALLAQRRDNLQITGAEVISF